jgi:hypothetical protein
MGPSETIPDWLRESCVTKNIGKAEVPYIGNF